MSKHTFTIEELDDCIKTLQRIMFKEDEILEDAVTTALSALERAREDIIEEV